MRSFPFLFEEEDDDHIVKQQNEEIKKIFDSKDESELKLLGHSFIFLQNKRRV
jgi:hypothetical protein